MKKFLILQIILVVIIHFTADAKRLVEPQPNCPLVELQIQENNEEDSAVIVELQDFDAHFFLTRFVLPVINKADYKIQILKPPQNIPNFHS
jgi:hypothetical protein